MAVKEHYSFQIQIHLAALSNIRKRDEKEFIEVPLTHGMTKIVRGIGVADMAKAILKGGNYRANGELAYHVLEAMHGFHDSSKMENTI